jgi:hypothetical protein
VAPLLTRVELSHALVGRSVSEFNFTYVRFPLAKCISNLMYLVAVFILVPLRIAQGCRCYSRAVHKTQLCWPVYSAIVAAGVRSA